MSFRVGSPIREILTADNGVEFRVRFSPDTVINSLAIKHEGRIIASDSNVEDETYWLPSGRYKVSVTFWGPVGTEGTLTVNTLSGEQSRTIRIYEGHVRETNSVDIEL